MNRSTGGIYDVAMQQCRPRYDGYKDRIRTCFQRWPEVAGFYKALIDYLDTATEVGFSPLQIPKTFVLAPDSARNSPSTEGVPLQLQTDTPAKAFLRDALAQQSHITVVEGFLAPETIGILGTWYQWRPEFFIDHLAPSASCDFGTTTNAPAGRCELPILPSQRDNIIHVRFLSLLELPSKTWKSHAAKALASPFTSRFAHRSALEEKRRLYEDRLFKHRRYGATRFRALHVCSDQWLLAEQMVSFAVKQNVDGTWHGLFLLDSGRECNVMELPWTDHVDDAPVHGARIVPVVPYNLSIPEEGAVPASSPPMKQYSPYHPGSDIQSALSASGIEAQMLAEDPFYILSHVYQAAARSRIQVLSFIEADIVEPSPTRDSLQNLVPEQLQLNLQLLRRIKQHCKEDLSTITVLGSASWPRSERSAEIHHIKSGLQRDYEYLIEQCQVLALLCKRTSTTMVSLAQLEESSEGFRASRNVADLTAMAALFIPLSYVSSCLSMNVNGIEEGVPVWLWAAMSVISLVVMAVVTLIVRKWRNLLNVFGALWLRSKAKDN